MVSRDSDPGWGGGGTAPSRGGMDMLSLALPLFHLSLLFLWQTTRP